LDAKKKETTIMRNLGFATAVASGSAAAVLGLAAPAVAAPSGLGDAQRGYAVLVNHVGSTPLSQSTDPAVRPGHTDGQTDSGNPGDDLLPTVTLKTVYAELK
jgi:hypothetical protein